MNTMELIAPCHFGLEAVLKREIIDLGYEIASVEDGRVAFYGDAEAICRANIFLRTAERVLLKVGAFEAVTYDELFEKTKALPWVREGRLPSGALCFCDGERECCRESQTYFFPFWILSLVMVGGVASCRPSS